MWFLTVRCIYQSCCSTESQVCSSEEDKLSELTPLILMQITVSSLHVTTTLHWFQELKTCCTECQTLQTCLMFAVAKRFCSPCVIHVLQCQFSAICTFVSSVVSVWKWGCWLKSLHLTRQGWQIVTVFIFWWHCAVYNLSLTDTCNSHCDTFRVWHKK